MNPPNGQWLTLGPLLAILLGLGIAVVACGGEDDEDAFLSSTPDSATTQTAPVITGSLFEYPARGYRVHIPPGWSLDPDLVTFGGMKTDGFFSPDVIEGVQPNISVTREDLPSNTTAEAYVDIGIATFTGLGAKDLDVARAADVGGSEAFAVKYSMTRDSMALDKTDVIFVGGDHGWVISLTVPGGQRASYEATLDEFLASFQLLSPEGRAAR